MSFVLGNYLRRRVTTQIIGLLLALTGLMQLLALLEVTSDVLERHLGIAGVLRYSALSIPSQMLVALPLAGLLGSMATFYAMARAREITALRSAGVGLWRLLIYLLPVPVLFAALHLALAQKIVPMSEGALKTWWDSTMPLEEHAADPQWVPPATASCCSRGTAPTGAACSTCASTCAAATICSRSPRAPMRRAGMPVTGT